MRHAAYTRLLMGVEVVEVCTLLVTMIKVPGHIIIDSSTLLFMIVYVLS